MRVPYLNSLFGLVAKGIYFRKVTRCVSEEAPLLAMCRPPSLTLRVTKVSAIGLVAVALCMAEWGNVVVAAPPAPGTIATAKSETVILTLRPRAHVVGREVFVSDVASVTGGNAEQRKRVLQLDLNDPLAAGESVEIAPPEIEFRLRLAGIDPAGVSIRGPAVRVTSDRVISAQRGDPAVREVFDRRTSSGKPLVTRSGSTASPSQTKPVRANAMNDGTLPDGASHQSDSGLEKRLVQAAEDCVRAKLPWSVDDVEIRLAVPVPRAVSQVTSPEGYECRATLRTNGPAVGRVQVQVVATAPDQPSFDVAVQLDVRHFDDVVLAAKTIERGRTIQASDVYVDRQDVTTLNEYCSNTAQLVGAKTKRTVRPLVLLKPSDAESVQPEPQSMLVKRRDQVRMVAKLGLSSIIVTGEAQQDGRLGETIRLQNTESKKFVQGRVTAANEVEITF